MSRHQFYRTGIAFCLWLVILLAPENAAQSQESSPLNPVAQQALPALSMTLERPLFVPSRHKPAPPAAPALHVEAPPPAPLAPPSVVLIGIMGNDQNKSAMLRSGSAEKILRVRIGDDVGGWKIAEIASRHVTFSLNDRVSSVSLFQTQTAKPLARNTRNGRGQRPDDDGVQGD